MPENIYDRNGINDSNEHDSLKMKDFIMGAVIGGVVGAATALFLAPKSGKDLRVDLNDQAALLKDKTNQLCESAINKGSEIANIAKEKVSELSQVIAQSSEGTTDQKDADELVIETQYIPIKESVNSSTTPINNLTLSDDEDIQEKLLEAKTAFNEEESKVKQ